MENMEANSAFLENANAFIRKDVSATFKPVAYFDEQLDCVRVIIRDCSVTEVRINEYLTIAEDNYPQNPADRYVGFTVKGVRHFIRAKTQKGQTQSVEIGAVLEQMLAELPKLIDDNNAKTLVEMAVNISFCILEKVEEKNVPLKMAA